MNEIIGIGLLFVSFVALCFNCMSLECKIIDLETDLKKARLEGEFWREFYYQEVRKHEDEVCEE